MVIGKLPIFDHRIAVVVVVIISFCYLENYRHLPSGFSVSCRSNDYSVNFDIIDFCLV